MKLNAYRLNSMEEPTDEQLHALMERVAIAACESSRNAQKGSFSSHKGAESSTVYHTFIATCKMSALSFRQFLKNYFTAFMEGRTDFENLTPATLGKSN